MRIRTKSVRIVMLGLAVAAVAWGSTFAKDFRSVKLPYAAVIAGKEIPAGPYRLHWKSHSLEATVTFIKGHDLVVTTRAHWEDRESKCERNTFVYETRSDGTKALLEIRLSGMRRALVFDSTGTKLQNKPTVPRAASPQADQWVFGTSAASMVHVPLRSTSRKK